MSVPLWLFLCVLFLAIIATIFCFFRNPLPFPDRGHRCFAVPSEDAAKVVVRILGDMAGLKERFTFDPFPTHQTLLWDNTTVIIRHDEADDKQEFPPNALSVAVAKPREMAIEAAELLKSKGFTADIKEGVVSEADDKLVLLVSSAFCGWVLVFRRHILTMGKLPNRRRLT